MDSDILLATLPPWGVESPPIGLAYLDSYVRSKGIKSKVFDFNIYFHNSAANEYKLLWHIENKNYWSNESAFALIRQVFKEQIDYAAQKLSAERSKLIGFSVVDPKERITIEVIRKIKKLSPEKKIILGGPACSTEEQRDFFIDNIPGQIDYFVVGEGEETLLEIIRRQKNGLCEDIAGLAHRVSGGWKTIDRAPVGLLDAIPFPDYKNFNLDEYIAKESMLVEWSRGCLGRCSFCKNFRLTPGYRFRSPKTIFDELSFLKNNQGINNFTVCDNLMNGNIPQLTGVCELIIKRNLGINWSGQIAPRSQMPDSLFKRMRLSGCFKVQIGLESGSDAVLRMMKKPYTPEIAARNIKAAKKSGMETEIFILVGFPGETEREFNKTKEFLKRNARYIDKIKSINSLHLIAGTEIYENPSDFNLKALPKNNWHYLWETNDANTYPIRKRRVEELLDLAMSSGLKVQETNIKEGKEVTLSAGHLSESEKINFLKISLVSLQRLPCRTDKVKKKRNIFKWLLLIFSVFFIFFYIIYFWSLMFFRNRIILGGRKG